MGNKFEEFEEKLKSNNIYISTLNAEGIEKAINNSKSYIEELTKELFLCNNIKRSLKEANDILIERQAIHSKNIAKSKKGKNPAQLPDIDYRVLIDNYRKFRENDTSELRSVSMPSKRLFASKTGNVTVEPIKDIVSSIKNHETALIRKIDATINLKNLYTSLLKSVNKTQSIIKAAAEAYTESNKLVLNRDDLRTPEKFETELRGVSESYSTIDTTKS